MKKPISKILLILILIFTFGNICAQSENQFKKNKTEKWSKKKIKLMKNLSEKTCSEFNSLKVQSLNEKIISDTYIKILMENNEKVRKHYETLSEKGLKDFMKDLTTELNADCKLIQEFIKKRK
jgi:hypothetical protein